MVIVDRVSGESVSAVLAEEAIGDSDRVVLERRRG